MKGFAHKLPDGTWCNEPEVSSSVPETSTKQASEVKKASPTSTGVEQPVKTEVKKPERDLSTLKTITDMYKACFADFGLQPKAVMAELNITSWTELTLTPVEAYKTIASVRAKE